VNVRDPRDAVACAGDLTGFWPGISDHTVHNQSDAHSVSRYLSKEEAGSAVLAALPDLAIRCRDEASEIDENILRRHFVAIATATYDDPYLGNLPEARDEVQALAGWFCSKGLADRLFTHQYPELADDPTKHRYGPPCGNRVQTRSGGNQMPPSCTSPATAGAPTKTTGWPCGRQKLTISGTRLCGRQTSSAG